MTRPKIIETLEGLMLAVPAEIRDGGQPGRWQSRFDGIPRMAASAVVKFGRKDEAKAEDTDPDHSPQAESDPEATDGDQRERIDLNPARINHVARRCAELVHDTIYMRGRFPSARLCRPGTSIPMPSSAVCSTTDRA